MLDRDMVVAPLPEVAGNGDEPEMYFELDVDTDRGYRVRREVSDRRGPERKQ
ncbi:hypothetical protein ACFV8E_11675 [Streptomyces sp. NPDC059849]|uniref:hypothetical protein n=1 Tax=Streptomyces sp. NPDC059849 TaxID=3346969 RepID=UPI0036485AF8